MMPHQLHVTVASVICLASEPGKEFAFLHYASSLFTSEIFGCFSFLLAHSSTQKTKCSKSYKVQRTKGSKCKSFNNLSLVVIYLSVDAVYFYFFMSSSG